MNRKNFLKTLAILPLAGAAMKLKELNQLTDTFAGTEVMPVLFMGHGSPMNAIDENEFISGFRKMGEGIARPNAILCVSAHWETRGTFITAMEKPKTIHDFGGFPEALSNFQYPAPGSPQLANDIQSVISKTHIGLDHEWGLDHGAWSVITHLYPNADVPVIQLSLDYSQPPQYHYALAKELSSLRRKGVLIIGSGNMVHNLGMIGLPKGVPFTNESLNMEYGYDWTLEARAKMNQFILSDNHQELINYKSQGKAFELAIPTPEHYLPLLYTLALKEETDQVTLFNDKAVAGSLTMTSVKISA
jgi:4,5-DOPA dioxygenase extradiol